MARHPEPILHVDMDAFFASVEQRDDPSLRGRPVVVGGAGDRGVVAAASYEARRFGIHSALPMARARRLCPELVIVSHRFGRYREVSDQVRAIFARFTPLVEPLSLDEAFLDVAGAARLLGEPPVIGHAIRAAVREELDLPCSVGIGPTKSIAKLLSGKAKPDGLLHWRADEVVVRLRPLPVSDLWGAGPRTVERLAAFGLRTVGQVADVDLRTVQRLVGDALGARLHGLARGEDPRPVTTDGPTRSVSASRTFEVDLVAADERHREVVALGDRVARRLRAAGLAGRTVTLTVRNAAFETRTRSQTLAAPTDRTRDVVGTAVTLLDGLDLGTTPVRLLGVGVSGIGDPHAPAQLTLDALDADDEAPHVEDGRWGEVDRVVDQVASRFGGVRMTLAATLDEPGREAAGREVSRRRPEGT